MKIGIKKISSMILFLNSLHFAHADTWSKSDLKNYEVSILFPLPVGKDDNGLLNISSEGLWGKMIPQNLVEILPPLDAHHYQDDIVKQLRVVGIRLDPCFPAATAVERCTSQIRMIWQPVIIGDQKETHTYDQAVHTFYQVPAEEFNQVISKMKSLRQGVALEDQALGIHPIIQKQGLMGPYFQDLKKIILASTGSDRLIKMTFMILFGEGIWEFGGFDFIGEQVEPMIIPRIGLTKESFYNTSNTFLDFVDGGPVPAPIGTDIFNMLITNSKDIDAKDEQAIIKAVIGATRIENPHFHNPHTIDCVSCHIAQAARIWSVKNYPLLSLESSIDSVSYKSKYNLLNESKNPGKTTMLRSFGYDGSAAFVNQRVINETAAVLEYLN